MLTTGANSVNFNDLLVIRGDVAAVLIYTYVHNLYISDYGGKTWWTTGSGSVYTPGTGFTTAYAMHPILVPANIDRVGLLMFGNAAASNTAWVSQTFMTDGFTQTADFGPLPTPI